MKKAQGSSKKRKKDAGAVDDGAVLDVAPGSTSVSLTTKPASAPVAAVAGGSMGGIKNAATASLTAKVLLDEEERKKRQKLGMNDNLKSLFSADGTAKDTNFMTRGYSIPAGAKR